MSEWINVKGKAGEALYNLDHVVVITKVQNGMAVLILTDESQILTDVLYDALVERLDRPKYEAIRID